MSHPSYEEELVLLARAEAEARLPVAPTATLAAQAVPRGGPAGPTTTTTSRTTAIQSSRNHHHNSSITHGPFHRQYDAQVPAISSSNSSTNTGVPLQDAPAATDPKYADEPSVNTERTLQQIREAYWKGVSDNRLELESYKRSLEHDARNYYKQGFAEGHKQGFDEGYKRGEVASCSHKSVAGEMESGLQGGSAAVKSGPAAANVAANQVHPQFRSARQLQAYSDIMNQAFLPSHCPTSTNSSATTSRCVSMQPRAPARSQALASTNAAPVNETHVQGVYQPQFGDEVRAYSRRNIS